MTFEDLFILFSSDLSKAVQLNKNVVSTTLRALPTCNHYYKNKVNSQVKRSMYHYIHIYIISY